MNLVSRRDRGNVLEVHITESRLVTRAMRLNANARCLDLGSGGGLPGLVIAVLRPDVAVTCLDARSKKMGFVQAAAKQLDLRNVSVYAGRAELLARHDGLRGAFDVVVSRALARMNVVAELARGFLAPSGMLSAVKGSRYPTELAAADEVASRLRYERVRIQEVRGCVRPTWLLNMRAIGLAPEWVPRQNGVPQAQPLEGRP